MNQLILNTKIHAFDCCAAFGLVADDLVLTNEYIYKPHFGSLNLPAASASSPSAAAQ